MSDNRPIAVLDSGIGGLNVMNALKKIAPNEEIYYLGDTANFPYGMKSSNLINDLALKTAKELILKSNAKLLVVACHTISSLALFKLSQELSIKVIGVNAPSFLEMSRFLQEKSLKEITILSTKATLSSGYYRKAFLGFDKSLEIVIHEFACGPLVNLIEDGYDSYEGLLTICDQIIPKDIRNSDALLLGCTHFPVLEPVLKKLFKEGCHFFDAAASCSRAVLDFLIENKLENNENIKKPTKIFVSDNPERFKKSAQQFIPEPLEVNLL